jgi:hypothetical protein
MERAYIMIDNLIDRYITDLNIMIIENLLLALLCGVGILIVFFITYSKVSVNSSFAFTLLLLPPISGMIALVINNDIVLAIGMVGSLSIVRFRHSMKESKNLVFIFWAVTAGIACGLSLRFLAVLSCAMIAVFIRAVHFITRHRNYGMLTIKAGPVEDITHFTDEIENIFKELSLKYEIKYKSTGQTTDILYELKNKKGIGIKSDKTINTRIMEVDNVSSVKFIKMCESFTFAIKRRLTSKKSN